MTRIALFCSTMSHVMSMYQAKAPKESENKSENQRKDISNSCK